MHLRDWHGSTRQSAHDRKFSFDGVSRRQQLGNGARLGAHHIGPFGGEQFVGGVGLPAFEHLDAEWPFKFRQT